MKRIASLLLCGLAVSVVAAHVVGADEKTPPLPSGATSALPLEVQIQQLKQAAALTPLSGPGVTIRLHDRKVGGKSKAGSVVPGVVHDYDLQHVVNELRAAGAEGIAINGVRLTERTSIRCVGPTIFIGSVGVSHPYKIEAIGDASAMQKALLLRGGLLDNFLHSGPTVYFAVAKQLNLAVGSTPVFRFAKP